MPVKTRDLAMLASRASKAVPALDDPEIGHLQAQVLKTLDDLGPDAFGYNVLKHLSQEYGVWLDVSQIYASIRKLLNKKPEPLIDHVATRASPDGGPPLKVYELTATGSEVLKSVAAHHRAVAAYLERPRKKRERR